MNKAYSVTIDDAIMAGDYINTKNGKALRVNFYAETYSEVWGRRPAYLVYSYANNANSYHVDRAAIEKKLANGEWVHV